MLLNFQQIFFGEMFYRVNVAVKTLLLLQCVSLYLRLTWSITIAFGSRWVYIVEVNAGLLPEISGRRRYDWALTRDALFKGFHPQWRSCQRAITPMLSLPWICWFLSLTVCALFLFSLHSYLLMSPLLTPLTPFPVLLLHPKCILILVIPFLTVPLADQYTN